MLSSHIGSKTDSKTDVKSSSITTFSSCSNALISQHTSTNSSRPAMLVLPKITVENHYSLYLLANDSAKLFAEAENLLLKKNAILLYPVSTDDKSDSAFNYKACFIQYGKLLTRTILSADKKTNLIRIEVAVKSATRLNAPGEVWNITTIPEGAHLIKRALAPGAHLPLVLQLPEAVLKKHVLANLDKKSLVAFGGTLFPAYQITQPLFDQERVKQLFTHILNGEIDEVKIMLAANPGLASLQWKGEKIITNKGGQQIYVEGKTAYQFALGEEDNEMIALLKDCVIKVSDVKEALTQLNEQFAEGWEVEEEKRWLPVVTAQEKLHQAIRDAKVGDITSSDYPRYKLTIREDSEVYIADVEFRMAFQTIFNTPIKIGRHYNPKPQQLGWDNYYDDRVNRYNNNWNDPRAMLLWRRCIGYNQRFMPANYAQAFCGVGLFQNVERLENGEAQSRSLTLQIYDSVLHKWATQDLYPLLDSVGPGFDYSYGSVGVGGELGWEGATSWIFQNLCQSKIALVQNLRAATQTVVLSQQKVLAT